MNFTSVLCHQVMMVTQLESGLLEMLGMVAMVMEEGAMACMMEEGGVVSGVQVLHTTHTCILLMHIFTLTILTFEHQVCSI